MFNDTLRFLIIFLYAICISFKLFNTKLSHKIHFVSLSILSLVLFFATYFSFHHIEELAFILPILFLWFFISLITLQPRTCFVVATLSFMTSYCLFAIGGFVLTISFSLFRHITYINFPLLIIIFSGVFEFFLVKILFAFNRFKKGMPFLLSTNFINIANGISLLLIAILMFKPFRYKKISTGLFLLTSFVLCLSILIYWWQAQLTKSYKHALELRELESLRTELQEKDKLIQKLTKQNESLGKLIHKDNKLIPAMDNAVREYLATDFSDITRAHEKGTALLIEIEELSKNRTNIIAEIYQNKCKQHATGITALDTLLNYMEKRAYQDKVQFSVHIATELAQHIPSKINTDDLIHVLSDLLENALIATANSNTAHVQLQFYQSQKNFVVEVADTGIPFAIPSLVHLGLTRLTTHADTGGSGIGLMDIWEIKEKYRASLHITEYEANQPYTKKISLIFNKKNIYSITSCRHEEIAQQSKRNDLQLYKSKKN